MTNRFESKVVVITGGTDGIGLASAKCFAEEGAHVYVTGRQQARLDKAVAEIGNGAVGVREMSRSPPIWIVSTNVLSKIMPGSMSFSPMREYPNRPR